MIPGAAHHWLTLPSSPSTKSHDPDSRHKYCFFQLLGANDVWLSNKSYKLQDTHTYTPHTYTCLRAHMHTLIHK